MTVRDALLQQKRELELRKKEPYIERTAELRGGNSRLIRIVLGPRRAGKSFFLTRHLMAWGQFGYVNFDDEELNDKEKIPDILTAVEDLYAGTKTLLMDEIQNIPGWELLANRLARQGYRLYITGSNAHLLRQGTRDPSYLPAYRNDHLPVLICRVPCGQNRGSIQKVNTVHSLQTMQSPGVFPRSSPQRSTKKSTFSGCSMPWCSRTSFGATVSGPRRVSGISPNISVQMWQENIPCTTSRR